MQFPTTLKTPAVAALLLGALAFASTAQAQITLSIAYDSGTNSTTLTYNGTMGVGSTNSAYWEHAPSVSSNGLYATSSGNYIGGVSSAYANVSFTTFDWPVASGFGVSVSGDLFGFDSSRGEVWGPTSAAFTSGTMVSGVATVTGKTLSDLGFTDGETGSIIGNDGAFTVNWTASDPSAVPEPSTYASLMGLAAIMFAFRSRRRAAIANGKVEVN